MALEKGLRLKVPRSVKLKFIGQNVSLRVARIMSIGSKRQRGPQLGAKTISEQQWEVALHSRVRGKYTPRCNRNIHIYSRLGIIEKYRIGKYREA